MNWKDTACASAKWMTRGSVPGTCSFTLCVKCIWPY